MLRATPPRLARLALALAAAAVLAVPAAARAVDKVFAAGSLIIPMTQEYQTVDAQLAAYGMIYTLLYESETLPAGCTKRPTFHWAIQPNKRSQYRCNTNKNTLPSYGTIGDNDGCDFVVQSSDGIPVAEVGAGGTEAAPFNVYLTTYSSSSGPGVGTTAFQVSPTLAPNNSACQGNSPAKDCPRTVMKYYGGPFVIDATDKQCVLWMLANVASLAQYHKNGATLSSGATNAKYVRIHAARNSFTAPIARVMNQKPPLIALTGDASKQVFVSNVLQNAGLDAITNWNNGVVYESHDQATLLGSATANGASGLLRTTKPFGMLWGADGMSTPTSDQHATLDNFLDDGNGAYIEATSIDAIENSGWPYLTTTGVQDDNSNIAFYDDCNDRLLANNAFFRSSRTGSCLSYSALSQPWAQTGDVPFQGGQASYKGYHPLDAFGAGTALGLQLANQTPVSSIAVARYKDNNTDKGLLIYLSGMRFDNARVWGERMIMNSVLANVPLVIGTELARSEPVGYHDASVNPATDRVYQGTYVQLPDPREADFIAYSPSFPQRWNFPYTEGHLYEYDLTDLNDTSTTFACGATVTGSSTTCPQKNWDAALKMPSPHDRTIFTALNGSGPAGWNRVSFEYNQVGTNSTGSGAGAGCADEDGDGKCDLAQALTSECGSAGVLSSALKLITDTSTAAIAQRAVLGMFVQQVRGYCSAHNPKFPTSAGSWTTYMEPSDSQCDNLLKQTNRAALGGIDHGSPAIVGASRYVTDSFTPTGGGAEQGWTGRPVVAYVGARDGMLHALYISGGVGWKDPDGNTLPSGVQAGQELWAFIPPGQLCGLASNNAMVDASVNVIDVLGNFPTDKNGNGVIDWDLSGTQSERPTGVQRWRTVLLAAAGQGGSELFAMDVTSPFHPVLLWHVSGKTETSDDAFDFASSFDWISIDKTAASTYALKWFDWDDGNSATDYIPTDYNVTHPKDDTQAAILDEIKFGRYNYSNLGLTYGTAIGKVWSGGYFKYIAYVATNMVDYMTATPLGFKGIEVFAVDLITGQRLWQWERAYRRTWTDSAGNQTPIADDTIPGRVALADIDADGSVDRIYVGDLEGHLWELSAIDGRNLNYLQDKKTPTPDWHSFPLFGSIDMTAPDADSTTKAAFTLSGKTSLAQQPLTSPIGQGRFTNVKSTSTYAPYLQGRLAVVQGAMGVDWSIAPYEPGSVYVVPVYPDFNTRIPTPVDLNDSSVPDPLVYGVLKRDAMWRITLGTGERVFGMPRVANNEVIFNTAFGSFGGNITDTALESGNYYNASAATGATPTATANQSKSFGGVLVFGNKVIVTTDTAIRAKDIPAEATGGGTAEKPFDRYTPVIFKTWEQTQP